MCGIAGLLNRDGRPALEEEIRDLTHALAHRGPDGEGLHVDGPLGLGHRRLAILDVSDNGSQPMACLGGRYWVTFNGEIYNFIELRRDLEARGHHFRTDTDTEIIASAYHEWGPAAVLRFNGMWAFAIWDTARKELFLSRDRFGVKPLFYMSDPSRFAFASELKAFLFLRGFTARENEDAMKVALYRPQDFERIPETLIHGVRRVPAGHNMTVTVDGVKLSRWWHTLDHVPEVPKTLKAQAEEFRELFFDACRLRLRSDVPVATCLSGGLDSSSVICTMAQLRGQAGETGDRQAADWQRAFVATFPGTPKDEHRHAELAVRHSGAVPRYRPLDPELAIENLTQYAYDFENIGGSLLMPLWQLYRELRRDKVVVSLDGHGGDEVFAGYEHYVADSLRDTRLSRHPWRGLDLIRTLQPMNGPDSPSLSRLLLRELRRSPAIDRLAARRHARLGSAPARPSWAGSPIGADLQPADDGAERAAMRSLSPLGSALYAAVHLDHLPHILRNFERCSMAHGVEVRMPFMDWRLVCFAFGLPDESKIGGGFTKRVVREGMRGIVPEPLRVRKDKIGFSPPMGDWFRGGVGDWVWNQVNSPAFLESSVWNGPAVRDFVAPRHAANAWRSDESEQVWPLVQAQLWRQAFFGSRKLAVV